MSEVQKLPIECIEVLPVSVPYATELSLSSGGKERGDHVFIKLHTKDGPIGVGESAPNHYWSYETQASVVQTLDLLEDALIGVDAMNLVQVHEVMNKTIKGNTFAKAAIDMACYDATGKMLGVPVSALLGGRVRDRTNIGMSIGIKDIDNAVQNVRSYFQDGFRDFKIKVGADPKEDIERVRAIKEAVGDEATLRLDANQGYSSDVAIKVFSKLEREMEISMVEQPVPKDDISGMKKVTRALETPILADESISSPRDVVTLAANDATDLIYLKHMKVGGLWPNARAAAAARAAGCQIVVGTMIQFGVGTAAAAHFAASRPSLPYPSDLRGPLFFEPDLIKNPIRIENGYTYVSNDPGLGVKLDEDTVEQYLVA